MKKAIAKFVIGLGRGKDISPWRTKLERQWRREMGSYGTSLDGEDVRRDFG
jgi:hypothetical protein